MLEGSSWRMLRTTASMPLQSGHLLLTSAQRRQACMRITSSYTRSNEVLRRFTTRHENVCSPPSMVSGLATTTLAPFVTRYSLRRAATWQGRCYGLWILTIGLQATAVSFHLSASRALVEPHAPPHLSRCEPIAKSQAP